MGVKIGKGAQISKMVLTWPHQVSIGKKCKLEKNVYFKYNGIWSKGPSIKIGDYTFIGNGCEFNIRTQITIGHDSLIGSGCKFIDHDHGILPGNELIRLQKGAQKEIIIGDNVWLGYNVVVLKGVEIGSGSVVAAGAVVSKSIPPNEIWGGIPARKIGER